MNYNSIVISIAIATIMVMAILIIIRFKIMCTAHFGPITKNNNPGYSLDVYDLNSHL